MNSFVAPVTAITDTVCPRRFNSRMTGMKSASPDTSTKCSIGPPTVFSETASIASFMSAAFLFAVLPDSRNTWTGSMPWRISSCGFTLSASKSAYARRTANGRRAVACAYRTRFRRSSANDGRSSSRMPSSLKWSMRLR